LASTVQISALVSSLTSVTAASRWLAHIARAKGQ
jgi:hypothetical protein